jgi:hypothetical protein
MSLALIGIKSLTTLPDWDFDSMDLFVFVSSEKSSLELAVLALAFYFLETSNSNSSTCWHFCSTRTKLKNCITVATVEGCLISISFKVSFMSLFSSSVNNEGVQPFSWRAFFAA